MALLGAHMSIAGGLHQAVENAAALGMDTVQIFTHSPSQWVVQRSSRNGAPAPRAGKMATTSNRPWKAKPIAAEDCERFRQAITRHGLVSPIAHGSYLINLATPDSALWHRSVAAMVAELRRAGQLGLAHVIVHPGAFTTSSETSGIKRIAKAIDRIADRLVESDARILLENTAGQGTCLGATFQHLAQVLNSIRNPDQVGVCIDTCHAFAAGYDLRGDESYERMINELATLIGLDKVRAIHLNDSKRELGSRVDRHEHIGRGKIGLNGFRHIMRDARLAMIPMYLETPKGLEGGRNLDRRNLAVLRRLAPRGNMRRETEP